jgi:hypothetical protein
MAGITSDKPLATTESTTADYIVHLIQGRESILRMQQGLADLSKRCNQPSAMDDLKYFLSRPGALKKTPYLVLLSSSTGAPTEITSPDEVMGALLLYEYRVAGRGSGIFATEDTTGRRTLVAPLSMRLTVAMMASRTLLDRGAQSILISFRHPDPAVDVSQAELDGASALRWASREREIVGYLPLESTLDKTLAKMGRRTRNHLRYYRRRAEAQLGCSLDPQVDISRSEFLTLNRECAYAVPDALAGWRYDSYKDLTAPLLVGIRDKDGRWLSVAGGRRHNGRTEVHWQMNRNDLPLLSLSTIMRAYLIEHEISQGTERLYFEGGTKHSMNHSFVTEKATDLIVMRRSPVALLMRKLAKRLLPPEHMLLQVLSDKELHWHLVGKR